MNSNDKEIAGDCNGQNNGSKADSNDYPCMTYECLEEPCHTTNVSNFEILLEQLKNAQDDAQVCQYLEDLVILLGIHKVY